MPAAVVPAAVVPAVVAGCSGAAASWSDDKIVMRIIREMIDGE